DDAGMPQEERNRFLDVVVQESERLTRLINELLDLSRIEAGRMDWRLGACDLAGVIRDALAATGPLFEDRQIRLVADIEPGLPTITADRDRLIQVVINLLSNAAKFAQPGTGAVTVRLTGGPEQLCVSVEDDGPGVPEAHRETVFEKFRQVGAMPADKPRGTGLGLAICRQIVERFGGRIWVEQAGSKGAAKGAAFRFSLPAASLPALTAGED
ncbi:MAG: sensor histidine kinase, partial [Geminicoccales bacterium]